MQAVSKFFAGAAGLAVVAGAFAAPAAAQYYPPYGGGYGGGNVIVGAILDSILRGGAGRYGGYNQYGQGNERYLIDQCARATEQRLNGGGYYGNQGYYGGGGYGYGYNNAGYRVVQIDRVERKSYGLKVYGYAAGGDRYGNYGGYGGYNNRYGNYGYTPADIRFDCKVDYRGQIRDIDTYRNRNAGRYRY